MRLLAARMDQERLVKSIAEDMMTLLKEQGRAAVREIVTKANKLGVQVEHLPYVFWALASMNTELPNLGVRQKIYSLMVDITARTGVMPGYQRAFKPADDPMVDNAVDSVAVHMSVWASQDLAPALIKGYYGILDKWAGKVPEATEGKVHALVGRDYLDHLFREMLTLRSVWFEDGELVRRVVRFIPV